MKHIRVYIVLFLLLMTGVIWYSVLDAEKQVLTVAFLDVGQGDAVFIESPAGNQMLIDGGPSRSVLRELSDVMPFFDRSLDVVLLTHPDMDHVGGLPSVLETYGVSFIFDPRITHDTAAYDAFVDFSHDEEGAQIITPRRGQIIDLGGGAYVRVLFPDRHIPNVEANAGSVSVQLIYGDTEVLLTGDAPQSIEKYLVSIEGSGLVSDILKAGHHGSKTSTSQVFVDAVDPEYVVVSAGRDNRYGHPHAEVLEVIASAGAHVVGTYDKGTIVFESDGERVWRK